MKISFLTLGCKVNQFESSALAELFFSRGFTICGEDQPADVYVINTCTVTAQSDRKSKNAIKKARKLNPEAIIAVCGCLSQKEPEAISEYADVVYGTADKEKFVEDVMKALKEKTSISHIKTISEMKHFEELPASMALGRTRGQIKIEDGCVNFCSYCVIPYVRGPVRSLSVEDVLLQAAELKAKKVKEIVLTGIEISSYGKDLEPKISLIELLERVLNTYPTIRFRLGSLEASELDEEFISRAAKLSNLCPHFHLSLQSGSDRILGLMNRKYTADFYYERISLIYKYFKNPSVTTDLIVGFPSETQEDFQASCDLIEKCRFLYVHIFPFSKRKGTKAFDMPDQVPAAVVKERVKRAHALRDKVRSEFLNTQLKTKFEVLFEEHLDGFNIGHTEHYIKVYTQNEYPLVNEIENVVLYSEFKDGMIGEIVGTAVENKSNCEVCLGF